MQRKNEKISKIFSFEIKNRDLDISIYKFKISISLSLVSKFRIYRFIVYRLNYRTINVSPVIEISYRDKNIRYNVHLMDMTNSKNSIRTTYKFNYVAKCSESLSPSIV